MAFALLLSHHLPLLRARALQTASRLSRRAVRAASPGRAPLSTMAALCTVDVSTDGAAGAAPGVFVLRAMPPAEGPGPALDVCVALDKSGSMSEAANSKGAEGTHLFTRDDLTVRGGHILAAGLSDTDTLTVITFESETRVLLPPTRLDAAGRARAAEAMARDPPDGSTDLRGGMTELLVQAQKLQAPGRQSVCILLTDGIPSVPFGQTEMRQLLMGMEEAGKPNCALLSTLGFGYGIDSKLLTDLATAAGPGCAFGFIPDGTMLISVIVNLLSMLQNLAATRGRFVISSRGGDVDVPKRVAVAGGLATSTERNTGGGTDLIIPVGNVCWGQERTAVVRAADWTHLTVEFKCEPVAGPAAGPAAVCYTPRVDAALAAQEAGRADAMAALQKSITLGNVSLPTAHAGLTGVVLAAIEAQAGSGGELPPIVHDLKDEGAMALASAAAWERWGQHHLRSNLVAHQQQICNNFKDPGVQHYGGRGFAQRREELNALVNAMPPPVPSLSVEQPVAMGYPGGPMGGGMGQGMPVLMTAEIIARQFNNAAGGCFGGGGAVALPGGATKLVRELQKGDVVASLASDGTDAPLEAQVLCVLEFDDVDTVAIGPAGRLHITEWHPVVAGKDAKGGRTWAFPTELAGPGAPRTPNAKVYNFILSGGHVLQVDGVTCCTLGHGFEGPLISHAFYGTQKVVEDLKAFPGWAGGRVHLGRANMVLDAAGVICGYAP